MFLWVVLFGLVLVLTIAISVFLCIWVYRDANARGENGALWLIVVLVGNIVGLLVWLLVRPKKKRQDDRGNLSYCPNCGHPVRPEANYCEICGEKIL